MTGQTGAGVGQTDFRPRKQRQPGNCAREESAGRPPSLSPQPHSAGPSGCWAAPHPGLGRAGLLLETFLPHPSLGCPWKGEMQTNAHFSGESLLLDLPKTHILAI